MTQAGQTQLPALHHLHRPWGPRLLLVLAMALPAAAQVPTGWNQRQVLGADVPVGTSWLGAGTWAANQTGSPATLIDSLGLGNSLTGEGISLEGGLNRASWSGAIKLLAFRDTDGSTRLTLYRGHLTWKSRGGWHLGLEDEPLVWGYGLTGGYLLGEAARPFPRIRIASPETPLHLFGTSLGTWGFQWFTGRLESRRRIADNAQDPSYRERLIQANGEPEAPLFSGYRFDASFLEKRIECYANWTVMWGGTRNGRSVLSGYNLADYLTAITGLKDPLAETSIDFSNPNHPSPVLKNRAESSTNFDMGFRLHLPELARLLSAHDAWAYISRGTKGMTLRWGLLAHRPFYYLGKDFSGAGRNVLRSEIYQIWYDQNSYVAPNLLVPNDTFGLLLQWPRLRLGIEHKSTTNFPQVSYRSFVNDIYATGFYRDGDPLGEAEGGEADFTTLRVEYDFSPRLSATFWALRGYRPFRDVLSLWTLDHPGATHADNRFVDFQSDVSWQLDPAWRLRGGWAWEHHSAVNYIQGNSGNGFRWFLELAVRRFN